MPFVDQPVALYFPLLHSPCNGSHPDTNFSAPRRGGKVNAWQINVVALEPRVGLARHGLSSAVEDDLAND